MKDFLLVSVSMGYGHQRTIFPLKKFARGKKIINANDYPKIPDSDKRIWETSRTGYEIISRIKRVPLLGAFAFFIFDQFQKVSDFYPKRDLSSPTFQLKQNYSLIKGGWGKDLIGKLAKNPADLVTSFFTPAFMAEKFDYPKDVYCIVCDADMSRAWVSMEPGKSRIRYFAPNERVADRLKLYGVKPENIFKTGYPLPLENIGTREMEILKSDVENRLLNLDPKKKYFNNYQSLIRKYLGNLPRKSSHPLTLMFAVGGAGAQMDLGCRILKSLKKKIKEKEIKLILVAGTKKPVESCFNQALKELRIGEGVEVLFEETFEKYYARFNKSLRKTDILWTKPSELSFYSSLGLPIIIAPCLGSQEKFNREWLLGSGFAIDQGNPDYADQWIFDLLDNGNLAECAFQGFVEGEKMGTFNILDKLS
jgi:hypothetical protein